MRIKLSAPPIRHDLPAPMAETKFWRLLAEAKLIGPVESGLKICLGRRDPVVIAAFAARWQTLLSQLFNWRLWDVAYVMCGGCSNDSFEYFRSWIISQGESTANAAREDPVHWAMRLGQAPVPVDRYHFNAELPPPTSDSTCTRRGPGLPWPVPGPTSMQPRPAPKPSKPRSSIPTRNSPAPGIRPVPSRARDQRQSRMFAFGMWLGSIQGAAGSPAGVEAAVLTWSRAIQSGPA